MLLCSRVHETAMTTKPASVFCKLRRDHKVEGRPRHEWERERARETLHLRCYETAMIDTACDKGSQLEIEKEMSIIARIEDRRKKIKTCGVNDWCQ